VRRVRAFTRPGDDTEPRSEQALAMPSLHVTEHPPTREPMTAPRVRRLLVLLVSCLAAIALTSSAARAAEWPADKPLDLNEPQLRDSAFLAAHYVGLAGSDKGVSRVLLEISLLNSYFRDNPA
jgi:hypothetical protein